MQLYQLLIHIHIRIVHKQMSVAANRTVDFNYLLLFTTQQEYINAISQLWFGVLEKTNTLPQNSITCLNGKFTDNKL